MRYLLQFLWKNNTFILFLVLEFISLFIVVNGNRHQSVVFSNIANQYGGKVFTSYTNIRSYFHLKKDNNLLSEENVLLREQLSSLKFTLDSTNLESFSLLNTIIFQQKDSSSTNFDFISAKVINNSTNRQKNYIMLNKGRVHGVRKNMGIIGPNGIVGVIFETSEKFSSGISLLNIKLNVSAKLKSNNELGTIIWDGVSPLFGQLDAVENYVSIAIGDTIITSGFSHIFPEGEYIGTVEDYSTIPGKTSWNIKVRFNTSFSRLSWVSIVRNKDYEEQMALEAIKIEE